MNINCTIYTSGLNEADINQLTEDFQSIGIDLKVPATLSFDPSSAIQVVFSFLESHGTDIAVSFTAALLEKVIEHIVDCFKNKKGHDDSQKTLFFSLEFNKQHAQVITTMSMTKEEQSTIIHAAVEKLLGEDKD